jgi:hypothetical protein
VATRVARNPGVAGRMHPMVGKRQVKEMMEKNERECPL